MCDRKATEVDHVSHFLGASLLLIVSRPSHAARETAHGGKQRAKDEELMCSKSVDDLSVFAANCSRISRQPAFSCRDFLMELHMLTLLVPIKVHINQQRAAMFTLYSLLAV